MDEVDRQANFSWVAYLYVRGLETDCWSRLLNAELSVEQTIDWGNYLFNYTSGLFGCGLVFEPLPGGLDTFALSNTDVVGVPSPMLSPDDASALIDHYVAACAARFEVSMAVLEPFRARLEQAAVARIDPNAAAILAACLPFPLEVDPGE